MEMSFSKESSVYDHNVSCLMLHVNTTTAHTLTASVPARSIDAMEEIIP